MPKRKELPPQLRVLPYQVSVGQVLDYFNLEVTRGEKIRIGQLAADSMRLIYGIPPVRQRNKIYYTEKTIPCIYRALDLVIPDWREQLDQV